MKWELLAEHRDKYIKKIQKVTKTGSWRPRSAPGSPSPPKPAKSNQDQGQYGMNQQLPQPSSQGLRLDDSHDLGTGYPTIKNSRSVTPPLVASYNKVAPLEAYTPHRGSRLPALRTQGEALNDLPTNPHNPPRSSIITVAHANDMVSSQNHRPSSVHGDSAIMPSPPRHSPYADDHLALGVVTPAPQRQHPRLAPHSTGQLPSYYLPTFSPAPFWKYLSLGGGGTSLIPDIKEDDDEDELGDMQGIDLARGFEKIGKFHLNGRIAGADCGAP
ncbi:unnamed protein product [Tuber aestivum]|uniref:Uncharacterized protein n=1 Tax=Tuber aestivum TaxID=59557 RepID=A0A292PK73_9PEZI|nr:unnamed protein product [Tuber aestivum]